MRPRTRFPVFPASRAEYRLEALVSDTEHVHGGWMRNRHRALISIAMCGTFAVHAQTWSPQKNVELVVGSAPGGSNDKTARTVERIVVLNKLIPTSITVSNKPGGGSTIAFTYVQQHAGDPHYLLVGTPSLLTNHITGLSKLHHTTTRQSLRF